MTDFSAFDTKKMDEYTKKAKETWGGTDAYKEFEQKSKNRTARDNQLLGAGMMDIFREMGEIKEESPKAPEAQALVMKLQTYITENFYTCTPEILGSLGMMYGSGGEFTENIDKMGGEGTAFFAAKAIEVYVAAQKK